MKKNLKNIIAIGLFIALATLVPSNAVLAMNASQNNAYINAQFRPDFKNEQTAEKLKVELSNVMKQFGKGLQQIMAMVLFLSKAAANGVQGVSKALLSFTVEHFFKLLLIAITIYIMFKMYQSYKGSKEFLLQLIEFIKWALRDPLGASWIALKKIVAQAYYIVVDIMAEETKKKAQDAKDAVVNLAQQMGTTTSEAMSVLKKEGEKLLGEDLPVVVTGAVVAAKDTATALNPMNLVSDVAQGTVSTVKELAAIPGEMRKFDTMNKQERSDFAKKFYESKVIIKKGPLGNPIAVIQEPGKEPRIMKGPEILERQLWEAKLKAEGYGKPLQKDSELFITNEEAEKVFSENEMSFLDAVSSTSKEKNRQRQKLEDVD